MKRTVYITQIPSRREGASWVPTVDVAPAREHGELKVILPSGLNYPEAAPAVRLLKAALVGFDPFLDFVLPVGDPLIMACATALLGQRFDSFIMLKWDRQQHRYFPFEVSL